MDIINKMHPYIVHFPIALFIIYSLFEIIALFFKDENFSRIIMIMLGLGVLFSILAVLTGNSTAETGKRYIPSGALELLETHKSFATITLFYYSILFFIRFYLLIKKKRGIWIKYTFLVLVLIGNIFIYLTGYYGGQLVFKYGVGTQLIKNPPQADK